MARGAGVRYQDVALSGKSIRFLFHDERGARLTGFVETPEGVVGVMCFAADGGGPWWLNLSFAAGGRAYRVEQPIAAPNARVIVREANALARNRATVVRAALAQEGRNG